MIIKTYFLYKLGHSNQCRVVDCLKTNAETFMLIDMRRIGRIMTLILLLLLVYSSML